MDVQVHCKRQERRPQTSGKPSLLGDGLLDRARSTLLGLLGLTTAVGLGIVALALNQGWPLVPGGPIPGFGAKHEAVGDATVADTSRAQGGDLALGSAIGSPDAKTSTRPRRGAGGTSAPAGSRSPGQGGTVVSHTIPTSPAEGSPDAAVPVSTPADPQPVSTPAPVPAPSPSPAPDSQASPAPQSTPDSSAPQQAVLASHESTENDGSRHPGREASHVHGHSQGGDRSGESRSKTKSDAGTSPPATPSPGVGTPAVPDRTDSDAPSWSHGGDRDRDRDRDHGRR